MGLTIHYKLTPSVKSTPAALKLVERMRQIALDLPFAEVADKVEYFTVDDMKAFDEYDRQLNLWVQLPQSNRPEKPTNERFDENRWGLIQAATSYWNGNTGYRIQPKETIFFHTWPGEECETANFGLSRFQKSLVFEDETASPIDYRRDEKTGRWRHFYPKKRVDLGTGWCWSSFCKTQYASNVSVEHFLKCHLLVVRMLDAIRGLGVDIEVSDEGHYWETRDVETLLRSVGEYNELVAGIGAALRAGWGDENIVSSITAHPDFETLEAKGALKLGPEFEQVARLVNLTANLNK